MQKPLRRPHRRSLHTRTLLNELNEVEVSGDDNAVRNLLNTLRDRSELPAKVFIFAEDNRPGYFGTWTRTSKVIKPRKPFERDVLERDYAYDSGEDWDDEGAEGADDVNADDAEEDDGVTEDPDSDLDSWLVDDDEEVIAEGEPPDILDLTMPPPPPKRKVEDPDARISKKRKVVIPLVPFAKGPCWEPVIGQCDYDAFKPFRIQLFNGKMVQLFVPCHSNLLPDRYTISYRSVQVCHHDTAECADSEHRRCGSCYSPASRPFCGHLGPADDKLGEQPCASGRPRPRPRQSAAVTSTTPAQNGVP